MCRDRTQAMEISRKIVRDYSVCKFGKKIGWKTWILSQLAQASRPSWKSKGLAAPIGSLCASFVEHFCDAVKGGREARVIDNRVAPKSDNSESPERSPEQADQLLNTPLIVRSEAFE